MKKILLSTIALLALAVSFTNCKKEEDKAMLKSDPGASVVNIAGGSVVIDSLALPDSTAYTFTWSKPDFGVALANNYTLQIAKRAADLGVPSDSSMSYVVSAKTSQKVTNAELRALGNASGVAEGTPGNYYVRVISDVAGASSIKPLVGEAKVFTYTYYNLPLAKIWVPGDYQGWDYATAPILYGVAGSGKYEGIIEKSRTDGTMSTGDFKFASIPSSTGGDYYGLGAAPKKLSLTGPNINLPDGTYYMTCNTKNLTFDYELRSWGIIGPGSPAKNWANDVDMRYDAATGNYAITGDFVVGEFKIRYNDGWAINRGWPAATGNGDGVELPVNTPTECENDGKNFGIANDGNYTVTFIPSTNTITIVKN
jgi:starch-binding outer membrane protein SusE/F